MACLNPIVRRNPTSHYIAGIDKAEILIPCGKCYGCVRDIRDEWFIRSYYEYKSTAKSNGFTLFVTFTYSEEAIPRIDKILNGKYKEYSQDYCFDYNHIRSFIHSLRKCLKDIYGLNRDCFTYLICSEYGGNNTKRSHLHALFHMKHGYKYFSPSAILEHIRRLWSKYGFVYPRSGNPLEALCLNDNAIKYCSKYVTKDLDFFDKPSIKALLFNADGTIKKDVRDDLRHYLPRHYQSKNYGIYLYDLLKNNPDAYEILDSGIRPFCQQHVYRIPRYILNRLCYDIVPEYDFTLCRNEYVNDETGELVLKTDNDGKIFYRRYLNSFGRKYHYHKLVTNVDKLAQRLKHDLSFIGLSSKFTDEDLQELYINENINCHTISEEIKFLMCGRSFRDLAIYAFVCKGRELPFDILGSMHSFINADDFYNFILQKYSEFIPLDISAFPKAECSYRPQLLDSFEVFANFKAILQMYNNIKLHHMRKCMEFNHKNEVIARRLKYYSNPH